MEIGNKYIAKKTVTNNDTAINHGSGGLEVFATPAMIALMETAAFQLLKESSKKHDSVGIEINVKHIKACRIGANVEAEAEIINIDGKKIFFHIIAKDEKGDIGSAEHIRYIIDPIKFMEKVD